MAKHLEHELGNVAFKWFTNDVVDIAKNMGWDASLNQFTTASKDDIKSVVNMKMVPHKHSL